MKIILLTNFYAVLFTPFIMFEILQDDS